jgi:hypothetical protein
MSDINNANPVSVQASDDVSVTEPAGQVPVQPDCEPALEGLAAALSGLRANSPSERDKRIIREAAEGVLASKPQCPEEFGRKAKAIAAVGTYVVAKRAGATPEAFSGVLWCNLWGQLARVPTWFFAQCAGFSGAYAFGSGGRWFMKHGSLIREMIKAAGPAAQRSLAEDIEFLRDPAAAR